MSKNRGRITEEWVHNWACAQCGEIFPENKAGARIWNDYSFCSKECEHKGIKEEYKNHAPKVQYDK